MSYSIRLRHQTSKSHLLETLLNSSTSCDAWAHHLPAFAFTRGRGGGVETTHTQRA